MTSLKLIPEEKRILFLKKFTAEIILNEIKKIESKKRIENKGKEIKRWGDQ